MKKISTLLIDKDSQFIETLQEQLNTYCPQVEVKGVALSNKQATKLIQDTHPELVFSEAEMAMNHYGYQYDQLKANYETILLSSSPKLNTKNSNFQASSYLQKPITKENLVAVVKHTQFWLQLRREQLETQKLLQKLLHHHSPNNVINIPTMEGIEFLKVNDIIRCEGLHRYTCVVIRNSRNIISSYSIGMFQKILTPLGFFSPHRSHLINLSHMKKFLVEGTILMTDGESVPVARRKRNAFLEMVNHL